MRDKKIDKTFLSAVIVLLVVGFFIFTSASWSLLDREGSIFTRVAFSQIFFGLFMGSIAMVITSKVDYKIYKKYAFYIFLFSILLTLLVFIKKINLDYNGAQRWVAIGPFTFQPSEFLKIGFIVYYAAWISGFKDRIHTFKYGLLPFIVITAIVGTILLKQPDTDTFLVIFFSGLSMFIAAGAKWKHIAFLFLVCFVSVLVIASVRPYIRTRIETFLYPSSDLLGAGYQVNQSLIAVGSGGITGRGFGQSIQKFNYLPEPIGDSIFAVAAEEFGLIGCVLLISLYLFLAFRGLKIALRSIDTFGGLLAIGIVILVISSSFVNIASMLGVIPLSGLPLLFVSHGGTALFFTLAEMGIILNISKQRSI